MEKRGDPVLRWDYSGKMLLVGYDLLGYCHIFCGKFIVSYASFQEMVKHF